MKKEATTIIASNLSKAALLCCQSLKFLTWLFLLSVFATSVLAEPAPPKVTKFVKIKSLRGFTGEALSAAFSPDNKFLAVGLPENRLIIWDVASWKIIKTLQENENDVSALAFSTDGKYLASGDSQKKIFIWNTSDWSKFESLKSNDKVNSMQFNKDNSILAIASENKTGLLYDLKEKEIKYKLKGHDDDLTSIKYNHDETIVATGSRDNSVILWDSASGKIRLKISNHKDSIYDMIFSNDGKYILSGGNDNAINITDAKTGNYIDSFVEHSTSVCKLGTVPNKNEFVSADCVVVRGPFGIRLTDSRNECKIILWDLTSKKPIQKIESTCDLTSLAISPDGKYMVAGYSLGAKDLVLFERK